MIFLAVLNALFFTDWKNIVKLQSLAQTTEVSMLSCIWKTVSATALEWIYAAAYGAGDSYTSPFYIKMIGAIWFLWAAFWGNIFLRKLLELKKEFRILMVILLFFIGYCSRSLFWFPLSIQAGCCATFFMYLGYLARTLQGVWKGIDWEIKAVVNILAFTVWISFIRDFKSFWLVHCDIGRGVIDIVGCLCGCYIIFLISEYLDAHMIYLSQGLSFLGRYSLIMLCIHNIELNLYPWGIVMDYMQEYGMPQWVSLGVVISGKLVLIISLTVLCSKSKTILRIFALDKNMK